MDEIKALAERVRKLEQSKGNLFKALVAAIAMSLLLFGWQLVLRWGNNRVRTLVAEKVLIQADDGEPHIVLMSGKDGGHLMLCDEKGRVRMSSLVIPDGPHIMLFDEDNRPNINLGPDGIDVQDAGVMYLTLDSLGGIPKLVLFDKTQRPRVRLFLSPEGPKLEAWDSRGERVELKP